MITLNGERGIEQVDSWEDIVSLPGFKEKIDPKKYKLREIIGRYIFKDKISCGLSTCRTLHGRGYIVTTNTGEVINIGNVCGRKHFGVDFKEQSIIFQRIVNEHNYRETIYSFLYKLEGYLSEISNLRSQNNGIDWVYKTSQALRRKSSGIPDEIHTEVARMVRARNGDILRVNMASEEEVRELEAIQRRKIERPYYISEKIGFISGLEIFYPENDLRDLVILDLQKNLNFISNFDVDSAEFKDLQHWSKWCSNFEEKLSKVKSNLAHGRKFLDIKNLKQFNYYLEDSNDKKLFNTWLTSKINKGQV